MREITFIKKNAQTWKSIEEKLDQQNDLSADETADLYVHLTDDLAYTRTFYPKTNTSLYLNQLASHIHRRIYKNKKEESTRFITFFTHEIPIAAYQSRKQMLLSFIFFCIAVFIGATCQHFEPNTANYILGDSYVNMTNENIENGNPMGVYESDNKPLMFFGIATNNIKVAFYVFIGGITCSVVTLYYMFINGIMLGAFQWFFVQKGYFWISFSTIFIHGALEITAIVIAGGAGLVLGNSILFPRTYTRKQSLIEAGKRALKIMLGLIPVFIAAAFLESFVTHKYKDISELIKVAIIVLSLTYIITYFFVYPYSLNPIEADDQVQ
ncbi:MAG: stage II sporulation protein M [Bacteroidota bacterium]